MKHVLCFGDSLTWGFDAATFTRFSSDKRWTGILQEKLGQEYRIIEEGLNGRTTVYHDVFTPFGIYGVGAEVLPMILDSHSPIDLVIIMLGSNDFQFHRQVSVKEAARGAGKCVDQVLTSRANAECAAPKVLLLSPPVFKTPKASMELAFEKIADNAKLAHYCEIVAERCGVAFLDTAKHVEVTEVDGVHLDEAANRVLAECLFEKVQTIL